MMTTLHCPLTLCLLVTSLTSQTWGQDKDFSVLQRFSLVEYSLAKCTDGTPAAYYADRVSKIVISERTVVLVLVVVRS